MDLNTADAELYIDADITQSTRGPFEALEIGEFEDRQNENLKRPLEPSELPSCQNLIKFITTLPSKKSFCKVYRNHYAEKEKAKYLYLNALNQIQKTMSLGNIHMFKNVCAIINYINQIEDINWLTEFYADVNNPMKQTNLIILACMHNKKNILQYILDGENKINYNLFLTLGANEVKPKDQDRIGHNAFYYAIRNSNCDLLNTLTKYWSPKYFQSSVQLKELDDAISNAYAELKLKNVLLTEELQTFVENKLINIRFSLKTMNGQNVKTDVNVVIERIDLVIQSHELLKMEYSDEEDVDEKFIFIASFIAQNIHVLKKQLKSSYTKLPWEEIEFCLVCFVSAHKKHQEINLIYRVVLTKSKILSHLENFIMKLKVEKYKIQGTDVNSGIPNLNREKATRNIVSKSQTFDTLYHDFERIRNAYSLNKIVYYIDLALSSNPQEIEGRLVIERALVVTGECLKNTLESPNLSDSLCEILLSAGLQKESLSILRSIRNLLSHSFTLGQRVETEANDAVNVFCIIQSDLKKIKSEILEILLDNKLMALIELFQKILECESFEDIIKHFNICKYFKFENINLIDIKSNEQRTIETLIEKLKEKINIKTLQQKKNIQDIVNMINSDKNSLKYSKNNLNLGLSFFSTLHMMNYTSRDVSIIKNSLRNILEMISPQMQKGDLEKVTHLSTRLYNSVKTVNKKEKIDYILGKVSNNFKDIGKLCVKFLDDSTLKENKDYEEIEHLILKIAHNAHSKVDQIKGLETLKIKFKTKNNYVNGKLELQKIFLKRIQTLKYIINSLKKQSSKLSDQYSFYEKNATIQGATEMLLIDILEIQKNYLANNQLLFDTPCPLLIGTALRNHLAHGNALVEILPYNFPRAVFANALMFCEEEQKSTGKNNKLIGQVISNDIVNLKKRFYCNLNIITNQKRMLDAIKIGNFAEMMNCISNGAEIKSTDVNKKNSLHFAAGGGDLEIVKFLTENGVDATIKDINGQNSLYIAVKDGKLNIVKFFIEELGLSIKDVDNDESTMLHSAAKNGHNNIVQCLLDNRADSALKNFIGFAPVHLAIINNHKDVVKTLINNDRNIAYMEAHGGFTPLHVAAEYGHLDIVDYLIKMNANVNAKNDNDWIPLHGAALRGFSTVVDALILKGSDVNAEAVDGCTPLYYAAEKGCLGVIEILVGHGANVNSVNKEYYSALHHVCKVGNKDIVDILLSKNVNIDIKTIDGMTPLHFAANNGHLAIVKSLIREKVTICCKNVQGFTPLDMAIQSSHQEVIEYLLANGANINSKCLNNRTPIHTAALNGNKCIVEMLIKNGANIDAVCSEGNSPLDLAIIHGHVDTAQILIENGADYRRQSKNYLPPMHAAALAGLSKIVKLLITYNICVDSVVHLGKQSYTPLHCAALSGNLETIKVLIESGANFKAISFGNYTPLHLAIASDNTEAVKYFIQTEINIDQSSYISCLQVAIERCNREIVEILIQNGAKPSLELLQMAIFNNCNEIAKIFIKHKMSLDDKFENLTPLATAAMLGNKHIVTFLLDSGANINIENSIHPIYLAAYNNHVEIVTLLLKKGADVNAQSCDGSTPLHTAAIEGCSNVVEILLKHGANIHLKDNKNRTALELAIANDHFIITKMLLEHLHDVNEKGNDDWSLLHIAAQVGNCDIVKYLIEKGANVHAKNAAGSKSIHIAAREGHINIVDYFLNIGLNVNELGVVEQTILHYAALKGQLEVVKYLLGKPIDINAQDANGKTPVHIAAKNGYYEIVQLLLHNSAIYNALDKFNCTPLQLAKNASVINILESTKKLFESVRLDKCSEIEHYVKSGACINAKNTDHVTPLHYAAFKGYNETVECLLKNNANPNIIGKNGSYSLHYAVKFNHLKVVILLLWNGAIYNAIDHKGKMPLYFSENNDIINLLKLIDESFEKVRKRNPQTIDILKAVKDVDVIKAVMRTQNRERQSLIVFAIDTKFPQVEQLKALLQKNVAFYIDKADFLLTQEKYQEALEIYEKIIQKRKDIFGLDNPATLDIQFLIALVLYKQTKYHKALELLNELNQKQTDKLGINNIDTLRTRSTIGLVLHRLGKNEEALKIYEDVYLKQQETLGLYHDNTLETQLHMALVLNDLKRFDEALNMNQKVYKESMPLSGTLNQRTIAAQNNIAMVLTYQKKYEEAIETYNEVYKRKKRFLGPYHSDTLRTLHNIASVHLCNKDHDKAVQAFKNVLEIQRSVLGPNHLDTLNTQKNIANALFDQGKLHEAMRIYTHNLEQRKAIIGENHPDILNTLLKMKTCNDIFKYKGQKGYNNIVENSSIYAAVDDGNIELVKELLSRGTDVNSEDDEGRTPLHFAVSKSDISLVKLLLDNGAYVFQVSKKGNTPLHIAASRGATNIVHCLISAAKNKGPRESGLFLDAQTNVGRTTALHISVQSNNQDMVEMLLQNGACYDIKNAQSKMPLDLAKTGSDIEIFLSYINRLFENIKLNRKDKIEQLLKEKFFQSSHMRDVVLHTRESSEKRTLIQIAQRDVANLLVQKMKNV